MTESLISPLVIVAVSVFGIIGTVWYCRQLKPEAITEEDVLLAKLEEELLYFKSKAKADC